MSTHQSSVHQQILSKAMKDDAFRQRLLSNPQETLQRELGISLPQGVTLHVYENTPSAVHFVLPMQPQTGDPVELSDADLEAAVGGLLEPTESSCSREICC
jgi:nitrile hydratase alpha subunit